MSEQMPLFGERETFVIPELVGKKLAFYHCWLMRYDHSFYDDQGELCHAGVLIGRGRSGIRLGTEWSWFAKGLVVL